MVLSQGEMRRRAELFIEKYKEASDERSYSQMFWRDFFDIFGISLSDVAVFEQAVKKFDGSQGYIDCFWKGKLVIEHKSEGRNLNSAFQQALGYLDTLSSLEKPRYIIVSDFKRIRLIDLFEDKKTEISLFELKDNIQMFSFIYLDGIKHHEEQEELNIEAAELMGELHDSLKEAGYIGHELELLLIRLLFCVYAEDTGIFNTYQFADYINNEDDPITVGPKIQQLFRILNQPEEERQTNLPEELSNFPYVNGKLFEEPIVPPYFDYDMYNQLKEICKFDWSTISPAIFGSIFQSIMNEEERRQLGAHYTSESNILKVINSLFMNDLWEEFRKAKKNYKKLELLREKMGELKFFDPACGCGNFLIIAYRELRLLEYEILNITLKLKSEGDIQLVFDSRELSNIKIENFYGIEIEEFPSLIAKVAMWFIEHQMDLKYEQLNIHKNNLPLRTSANIVQGNALKMDWAELIGPADNVFVLGNPPFVGSREQTKEQKKELKEVFKGVKGNGLLDYVAAWYLKAAEYIQNTKMKVCFVSTNSICQGDQVGILWEVLMKKYNIHINFAHQYFKWGNEARNAANVYVVIIGFSTEDLYPKHIYTYETLVCKPVLEVASQINQYLIDSDIVFIKSRTDPISNVSNIMKKGSKAYDYGNLTLSLEEKNELLDEFPEMGKWVKTFLNARDFLKGTERYCLWFADISPSELQNLPSSIKLRIDNVREKRGNSTDSGINRIANVPWLFENNQPANDFLAIPVVSSEKRDYIPMAFLSKDIIVTNAIYTFESATLLDFAFLTSKMHMAWVDYVCGRLKGDYRYSKKIVYNNFPFPRELSENDKDKIIKKAQKILDVRNEYPDESLEVLYGEYMPDSLQKAHHDLDSVIDKVYRKEKFKDYMDRMKFLFNLYIEYTTD